MKPGELIVITAGIPLTSMKPTNVVKLHRVNDVDAQGDTEGTFGKGSTPSVASSSRQGVRT